MDKIQEIFTAPWAIADNDYYRLLSLLVPCVAAGNLDAIEKRLNNNKITAYATTPYLANRWELAIHFATELFNLAVHRDTAHQRQVAVRLLAAFLHVK